MQCYGDWRLGGVVISASDPYRPEKGCSKNHIPFGDSYFFNSLTIFLSWAALPAKV